MICFSGNFEIMMMWLAGFGRRCSAKVKV